MGGHPPIAWTASITGSSSGVHMIFKDGSVPLVDRFRHSAVGIKTPTSEEEEDQRNCSETKQGRCEAWGEVVGAGGSFFHVMYIYLTACGSLLF